MLYSSEQHLSTYEPNPTTCHELCYKNIFANWISTILKKSPIPGIWFKLAYILTSWNRIYISQHKAEGNRREQSVAEIIYVSYQRKQKQQ